MNERELKIKFKEYLQQKGENVEKLDQTTDRFGNDVFNMFLDGLELHRKNINSSNKWVFWAIVLPQMKNKLKQFGDHFFKKQVYKKYESLFISFMDFAEKNIEYIDNLIFDRKKEKLENLVEGQYGKIFNKKAFLKAWHNYIKEDTGNNGDKLRGCLTDIYGYLNVEGLKTLYDIFFDSYKKCSEATSENKENKGKENYEKKDAFGEAFSNLERELLENKLPDFYGDKLSELKSLFGKYLNFVPKYRDIIFNALDGKTGGGKDIQKVTEQNLIDDLSGEENTIVNEDPFEFDEKPIIYENVGGNAEGDGFGPIKVIRRSRDENRGIYDQTERGDIIAPIDYGIFPDSDIQESGDENGTE